MKKLMKKVSMLLTATLSCALALPALACAEEPTAKTLTVSDAVYGAMYYLPVGETGYAVYDSKGNAVALDKNNGFFVEDTNGYTFTFVGSAKTHEIKVQISGNERVDLSYEKDYFAVGEKVSLPTVIAVDEAGKEMDYQTSLTLNGEKITVENNSFTPTSVGSYVYTVTADHFGEEVEKTSTIEVVEKGSYKLRLVAELGEEYGVNQAYNFFGYTPEYTTEKAFGRDSGSLKVTLNNDRTYNQSFSLKNLFIKDLTKCNEMYFYVYNDSDYPLTLSVNYGTFPIIAPRAWTQINISDFANELVAWSHAGVIKDQFNLKSIEGMTIANFLGDNWSGLGQFSLYFSSIYTWSDMQPAEVIEAMESMPEALDEGDIYDVEDLRKMYSSLNDEVQWENRAVYQSLTKKYIDFIVAQENLQKEENVSVYFDREFGLRQVSTVDCSLALDTGVLYNNKPTTKVTVNSSWEAHVNMDFPVIYDCTEYDEIYLYVRYDGDVENIIATFWWDESDYVKLQKGEWMKVSFRTWENHSVADQANVLAASLMFFMEDWSELKDVTFHISPLYAGVNA